MTQQNDTAKAPPPPPTFQYYVYTIDGDKLIFAQVVRPTNKGTGFSLGTWTAVADADGITFTGNAGNARMPYEMVKETTQVFDLLVAWQKTEEHFALAKQRLSGGAS